MGASPQLVSGHTLKINTGRPKYHNTHPVCVYKIFSYNSLVAEEMRQYLRNTKLEKYKHIWDIYAHSYTIYCIFYFNKVIYKPILCFFARFLIPILSAVHLWIDLAHRLILPCAT